MLPEIFAHRGNSAEAPENTLAAFQSVPGTGAEGVEFDVQLSRDGVPVVIHDETLERTTDGRGLVGDHPLNELKRLSAGRWWGAAHAGERIPTLAETLEVLRPTTLSVNIELKTSIVPYPGLVPRVLSEIRNADIGDRVTLSSFNHHSLLEAARLAPELPLAALLSDLLIAPWRYAASHGFQGLHVAYRTCTAELVSACHESRLALRTYTVDEENDFRDLREMGVDGVFTNHPRRLAAVRQHAAR